MDLIVVRVSSQCPIAKILHLFFFTYPATSRVSASASSQTRSVGLSKQAWESLPDQREPAASGFHGRFSQLSHIDSPLLLCVTQEVAQALWLGGRSMGIDRF